MLASAAADRVVKVHSVVDGTVVRAFEGHTGHALGVAWQPHGRVLASAGGDGAVKVWDITSGEQKRTITGPKKEVTGVRFAGATDELVVSAGDPLVRVYSMADGAVMRDFVRGGESPAGGDFVHAIAVAPAVVAAGYQSGVVQLWNRADARPLRTIEPAAELAQPGASSGSGSRSTR
jgi:WD40 repeat protein